MYMTQAIYVYTYVYVYGRVQKLMKCNVITAVIMIHAYFLCTIIWQILLHTVIIYTILHTVLLHYVFQCIGGYQPSDNPFE